MPTNEVLSPQQLVQRIARGYGWISQRALDDVKSLIWQINSFAPTGTALDKLRGSEIFPVKTANGPVVLRTRLKGFSIIDRQPWADAF